jgi:hypothetical protein
MVRGRYDGIDTSLTPQGGGLTELEGRPRWSGDVVQHELLVPDRISRASGSILNEFGSGVVGMEKAVITYWSHMSFSAK